MFHEPNDAVILNDANSVKERNQQQQSQEKLRFYKRSDSESEATVRLLVFDASGAWQVPSYKHFKIGGKTVNCITEYTVPHRLKVAESLFWKPYIYDVETREKYEVKYNEDLKKEFYEKYFNHLNQSAYNPSKVLDIISEAEDDVTLIALRQTAKYLLAECPVCKAIHLYEVLGVDSKILYQYKTAIIYNLLIVDMEAVKQFNFYLQRNGFDPKTASLEQVVQAHVSFSSSTDKTILPQIFSITASQFNKLVDDLKRDRKILSAIRGTNVIFKKERVRGSFKKPRFNYSHSFDLSSVNTPIHENPNIMEYISSNIYDLNKIFLLPNLDYIDEIKNSEELASFERMLSQYVSKYGSESESFKEINFDDKYPKQKLSSPSNLTASHVTPMQPVKPTESTSSFASNTESVNGVAQSSPNVEIPSCFGDARIYNPSDMKCYSCHVRPQCSNIVMKDALPF